MIFILSILSSLISTYFLIKREYFSKRFGLFDIPNSRKIHKKKVSNIGGVAIFIPVIISILLVKLSDQEFNINYIYIISLFLLGLFLLGIIDDKKHLKATTKIIFLIILFFLLIPNYDNFLVKNLSFVSIPQKYWFEGFWGVLFTFFCFFILFNTVNFIDGTNGLLLSLTIYWLVIIQFLYGNFNLITLTFFLSSIFTFLYNLNGKVFLGNSGSNLIAGYITFLIIDSYNSQNFKMGCDDIFFLLLFPGIDCVRVTMQRIINSKNPFEPDKIHLHHYMIKFFGKDYVWVPYLFSTMIVYLFFVLTNNIILSFIFCLFIYFTLFILSEKKIFSRK